MPINRDVFFNKVRRSLFSGSLSQMQVDGLNFMLDVYERDYKWTDLRWISYAFATAYHETAYTMQPIKEYGSQAYLQGKPYYPYFGRGYVQLTWEDNYRKMGSKLGVSLLGADKDKALDPQIAAAVMYIGMRDGDFTGKKLSTYFSATVDDPVNARRIINGTDKASTIAGYHAKFLEAFNAAFVEDVTPPLPPPEPEPPVIDMSQYILRADLAKLYRALADALEVKP